MTNIKNSHGTITSLSIGFVLSLLLTLSSYFAVINHLLPAPFLVGAVLFLACMQFVVQIIFFLHLDKESGKRWKTIVFISTIPMVLLVVIGSIWIMTHLNYNMMPKDVNQYMQKEEAIYK